MQQVVDRVSEGGLNFEIYDDGDCVLTNSPTGFVQFSAALIARLARKPGLRAQRQAVDSLATVPPSGPRAIAETHISAGASGAELSGAIRRTNIHKLPEGPGWQCTLVDESNHSVTHVYDSRTYARAGLPGTPIGQAGRIA